MDRFSNPDPALDLDRWRNVDNPARNFRDPPPNLFLPGARGPRNPVLLVGSMTESWWIAAQNYYNAHGYLVIATYTPRPIGHRVEQWKLITGEIVQIPQPFTVIAKTDEEDSLSQFQTSGATQ